MFSDIMVSALASRLSRFVEVPLGLMQTLPQPYLLNNALFVPCSIKLSTKSTVANEHSVIFINTCLNSPAGYQLNPHNLVFVEKQENENSCSSK